MTFPSATVLISTDGDPSLPSPDNSRQFSSCEMGIALPSTIQSGFLTSVIHNLLTHFSSAAYTSIELTSGKESGVAIGSAVNELKMCSCVPNSNRHGLNEHARSHVTRPCTRRSHVPRFITTCTVLARACRLSTCYCNLNTKVLCHVNHDDLASCRFRCVGGSKEVAADKSQSQSCDEL